MSSKRLIIYGIVALCLLGLYIAGRRTAQRPKSTASGNAAPDFTVTDIDGKKLALSDLRGKVVLLDFWATWCTPCKIEIPWFMEIQKKYQQKGLEVIGVSLDEKGWEAVKPFLTDVGVNYRVVIGDDALAQSYGKLDPAL